MATNNQSHLFLTFLGLPPDKEEAPICGAILPADWSARGASLCSACSAEAERRGLTVR
jgi:hypothetical protein